MDTMPELKDDLHELARSILRKLFPELSDSEFTHYQKTGELPTGHAARARQNWTAHQEAQTRWAHLKSLVDRALD